MLMLLMFGGDVRNIEKGWSGHVQGVQTPGGQNIYINMVRVDYHRCATLLLRHFPDVYATSLQSVSLSPPD